MKLKKWCKHRSRRIRNENEVTVYVEPNAHSKKIVGFRDDALQYSLLGDQIKIELSDWIIEDQYGREFDDVRKGKAFDDTDAGIKGHNYYTLAINATNATTTDSGQIVTSDSIFLLEGG